MHEYCFEPVNFEHEWRERRLDSWLLLNEYYQDHDHLLGTEPDMHKSCLVRLHYSPSIRTPGCYTRQLVTEFFPACLPVSSLTPLNGMVFHESFRYAFSCP